jgi:hypothetical protein
MPVTQVGAFYATGSKLLQRIYIPDHADSEIDQQFIAAGETLLKVPIATYQTGGHPAVQALIGAPTFSGRCALVHKTTSLVLDVIVADPVLYADPNGHHVIPHNQAMAADLWTGTGSQFTRRYVEINPLAPTALTAIVAVSIQNIDTAAPATPGNILMASDTLNVGSALAPSLLSKLKTDAALAAPSMNVLGKFKAPVHARVR